MSSPRNRTKQTIKAEKATITTKSVGKTATIKRKLPNFLSKIKLRPLEKIGLGLLFLAVIYWIFTGKSTPEPRPNPSEQIAPAEQLEEKASTLRPLYITIDSLKLRAQPKLDSNFIRYLAFDETVYDMGEQTKTVQTIRYSADEVRTEPWVKIRTENGEIGWVFGAGVNFYRKKRRIGVIDSTNTSTGLTTITEPSSSNTVNAPAANNSGAPTTPATPASSATSIAPSSNTPSATTSSSR